MRQHLGKQLSDMPKPFRIALGSCMKLPARDPLPQLPARLTGKLQHLLGSLARRSTEPRGRHNSSGQLQMWLVK